MPELKQSPSVQTIEQIRARARRRLIGAIILVVLAIAILPWLFNSRPRPMVVDAPIEIAGQAVSEEDTVSVPISQQRPHQPIPPDPGSADNTVVAIDTTDWEQQGNVHGGIEPLPGDAGMAPPDAVTATGANTAPEMVSENHPEGEGGTDLALSDGYAQRPASHPYLSSKFPPNMTSSQIAANTGSAAGATAAATTTTQATSDDGERAAALLGEPASAARGSRQPASSAPATAVSTASSTVKPSELSRSFVVQVGAYADQDKANEVRARLTMAGYTSFTQKVSTEAGKRIRVRVGPFNGRAAADAVAAKIRAMGLQAAVLSI